MLDFLVAINISWLCLILDKTEFVKVLGAYRAEIKVKESSISGTPGSSVHIHWNKSVPTVFLSYLLTLRIKSPGDRFGLS